MLQVVAAVIIKDGKVLVARRKEGIYLAGKWEFPGGIVEQDEAMVLSLVRGLDENFHIKVQVENFICMNKHIYEFGEVELYAYTVKYISGIFKSIDHDKVKWARPAEFDQLDFTGADIPVCTRIKEDPSEYI